MSCYQANQSLGRVLTGVGLSSTEDSARTTMSDDADENEDGSEGTSKSCDVGDERRKCDNRPEKQW